MDLAIRGRRALVANQHGVLGAACARVLTAEGVEVLPAVDDAVEIVVAQAATTWPQGLLEVSSESELLTAWDDVVDSVDLYRRVLPGMARRRWGRFVWIGTAMSRSLDVGDDEVGAIVTLAMRAVGKVVAAEAGPANVTANAVVWGGSATPDDVAAAVAFLCSEGAGYITGVTVTVDGGVGQAMF